MIADKIKFLREEKGLTQSDLAKKLGITRSSVNAWEMGISIPSTQYLVELAYIFKVSTDYLLGIAKNATIGTDGLTDDDIRVVYGIVEHLKDKNNFKKNNPKTPAYKKTGVFDINMNFSLLFFGFDKSVKNCGNFCSCCSIFGI